MEGPTRRQDCPQLMEPLVLLLLGCNVMTSQALLFSDLTSSSRHETSPFFCLILECFTPRKLNSALRAFTVHDDKLLNLSPAASSVIWQ